VNASEADEDAIAQRRLCSTCVQEPFLRNQVERHGENARCSYCDDDGQTISIGEMADRIDRTFEQHFELTPNEPSAQRPVRLCHNQRRATARAGLWYGEPDAISNAIGYAKFYSRSHDAVIRVYVAIA